MKLRASVLPLRSILISAAAASVFAAPAYAEKYASIVVDMDTAQVLHARNADDQRYPASLTKVMTLYMVFDALDSGDLALDDRMKVSRNASRQQPSKLALKVGSTIRVDQAIRALVTKSANDVAVVFAEHLGGTEANFAEMMTVKGRDLGLTDTRFQNASGLPDANQVTTARDMARLAEAVYLDHRDYYSYFSTPEFVWNRRTYKNHNTLLKDVAGVDGIKTGYTNASGYNLMASAERDGHRVIAVMLGGRTGKSRDEHVRDLLEAAFAQANGVQLAADHYLIQNIRLSERSNLSAEELAAAQLRRLQDFDEADLASASVWVDMPTAQGDGDAPQGYETQDYVDPSEAAYGAP